MKKLLIQLSTRLVTGIVVLFAFATSSRGAAPDILLIMPDQMRGDCLSINGQPVLKTPNLDSLAREGTLFRRAYSTCPSCIPARFAFLTGLHPETSGVVGFKSRPITTPTFPEVLGEAGYVTVLAGRCMHQDPPNKTVGYQQEILGSTYVNDDDYDRYLKKADPQSGGIKSLVKEIGDSFNFWQADPWPLKEELHPTSWVTRQAEKVITDTPDNKPLFLTASYYSPHPPLFALKKYFDPILAQPPVPPAHGDWEDWSALAAGGSGKDRVLLEGERLRRAEAGYYGLIEQLDAQLPSLITAFKARSEKAGRPWIILFTSDHGEMMGDHGYFRKCEPYEGSANIPLIICASSQLGFKAGQRCYQPVCLEDIMPTLLALAGVSNKPPVDGVNLLPTLRGEHQDIRNILHFEHAPCYSQAQAFQALTDGHFKYIWRPETGREQLFDLDNDPHEEHDLALLPAEHAVLVQWRGRIIQQLTGRPEGFTDGQKLITGRPYRAIMQVAAHPN